MAAVITLLCTCSDDCVKVDPIWGASGVPKPHGSNRSVRLLQLRAPARHPVRHASLALRSHGASALISLLRLAASTRDSSIELTI